MFKRLLLLVLPMLSVSLLFAASALAEPIGLKDVEVTATNEPTATQKANHELGSPDLQAGSHPYALVTTFFVNGPEAHGAILTPTDGGLRNVRAELPPGFVGNANAIPKCRYPEFVGGKACPNDTAVGVATTVFNGGDTEEPGTVVSNPVYNLETPGGAAVEFGYKAAGNATILLDASVRTGGDYGITVNARGIPQVVAVIGSRVTIWGVPAAPVHNPIRGQCLSTDPYIYAGISNRETPEEALRAHSEEASVRGMECPVNVPVQPLLTNPTSCGAPRKATLSVQSWGEPGAPATEATESTAMPELLGCEELDFSPSLSVQPDGSAGSTPTGLNVDVQVPQESTTNPEGLGEADVKETRVALPPGVQISPSASDGLQACSNAQIGLTGEFKELNPVSEPGVKTPQFTSYLPGSLAAREAVAAGSAPQSEETLDPGVNFCPDASKIANVRIKTPLLEGELTGAMYLAAPQNFAGLPENPFSSLIAMYLVAEEPNSGVLVKLPGKVSLNEETGQITTTFEDTPALPFSELKLEFYGTARAPLTTPALCGTYEPEASFVPWSGTSAVHPSTSFQITSGPVLQTASGPQTAPCSDPLPFSPTLDSGTTNINAGSYSELDTTLNREDGQQSISSVQLHYPSGVSGLLSGVKLCGEQQANEGTCGPESLIGESIVSVGLGNDPYTVTGGRVYITGPYRGAPFGLSVVNPAKAGPFDLQEGRPVVVRAKIEVDPHTAALTVTTDPPGTPHAIPTIIDGIPLNIKHVNVLINRPDFTFNPTDCAPQTVTSTIDSAEGASAPASIPFQVTNCGDLKFAPKFSVSTSGKTSRADGESLAVKLSYPNGPGYSNISKVKVELPKGLPSRLSTLQKACTAAQFNANPAGCPAASLVGYAKAITPLIPVPLEGPAYFVSNGAEAFPNLVVVLQGYGVTIDLVGDTFISKSGVTSSTFKTVPDAPVGSFELTLPEGPYSALTTDGNPCTNENLVMPTEFVAQDGTTIDQSTKIAVTGCPKAKVAKKRHHKAKRRRARGRAARRGRRTGRAGRRL